MMKRQKKRKQSAQFMKMMKGGQKKSDTDTDRLSDLPDHILEHIIQFMDLKQCIQTCVLSKRWKTLWKSLNNIRFYHSGKKINKFTKFVSKVLSGRDHSLSLHTLNYVHQIALEKVRFVDSQNHTLLKVMEYVKSHNVHQLRICAGVRLTEDLKLPTSILYRHSLTYLQLNFWQPNFHYRSKIIFPNSLNLPALKTLDLCYLSFTTSDNGVVEPFSTCNMLSTLVINDCCLQDDGQTLFISNSNVSSLTVGGTRLYGLVHAIYKLVFCTPKLTSLTFHGRSNFLVPSTFNPLFLEEGNFYYTKIYRPIEHSAAISWLNMFANVKIMTLLFCTLDKIVKVLKNNGPMSTQPPCFTRLKSLKVELEYDPIVEDAVDMVLKNNGSMTTQPPSFVRWKSSKAKLEPEMIEKIRNMNLFKQQPRVKRLHSFGVILLELTTGNNIEELLD